MVCWMRGLNDNVVSVNYHLRKRGWFPPKKGALMRRKSHENQKSIEESVNAIFEMAAAREKAGSNAFEANWQASLELMLHDGSAFC